MAVSPRGLGYQPLSLRQGQARCQTIFINHGAWFLEAFTVVSIR